MQEGNAEGITGGYQTALQSGFDAAFYQSLPILIKLNQLEGMIR